MAQPLLRVTNLAKPYGNRRAVHAVSFRIEAGQTLGLIGPNGAGKSTTVSLAGRAESFVAPSETR